jgi:putative methyltransferase (TIGR04325 family)
MVHAESLHAVCNQDRRSHRRVLGKLKSWMRGVTPEVEPLPVRLLDFEGCHEDWPAAASAANPFDTIEWLDSAEAYLRTLLDSETAGRLAIEHYIVPVCVVAAEVAARRGELRILDFGGGVGVNFVNIRAALPAGAKLQYDIVDSSANRDRWHRLFENPVNCSFFTEIPRQRYDVVFASSTLQYIPDWAALLTKLADVCERWIVLPRLPITSGATFVASQNIRFLNGPHAGETAGTIAHRFFNRGELIGVLRARGFELVHDHFISDYGAHLTQIGHPPGDVTLRVLVFGSKETRGRKSSPVREARAAGEQSCSG